MSKETELEETRKPAGQALVEFALIIGVVLLMVFVLIESGRIFWGWVTVQEAAREGARYAITGQFDPAFLAEPDPRLASINATVLNRLTGLPLAHNADYGDDFYYKVEVWGVQDSPSGPIILEGFAGLPGQAVVVRVIYFVPIITPFLRPIVESVPVFGQVTLINELWGQQGGVNQGVGLPPELPAVPTPGPSPTPEPPPACYVNILPLWVANTAASVVIEGDINTTVTLSEYNPNSQTNQQIAGPINLSASTAYDCPGAASFSWGGHSLTAGNILIAESSDGSIDTAVIYDVVTPAADLGIAKTSAPNPVNVGEQLFYTIEVTNYGPTAATNVVVSDTLPVELTYNSAVTPPNTVCLPQAGNTILCSLGTVQAGETVTLQLVTTANPIASYQQFILNTATVSGSQPDPDPQNNVALELTEIIAPQNTVDIAVSKTASVQSPQSIAINETLTYLVTVLNNGPMMAEEVTVYDSLPFGYQVDSVTPSQGNCQTLSQAIVCNLGDVAFGGTATVTIVGRPTVPGEITNIARAWTSSQELNFLNNRAEVSTLVIANNHYIVVQPFCGAPGSMVSVYGYNWPTQGNHSVEIRWNSASGPILRTINNNPADWEEHDIQIPTDAALNQNHTIVARRTQGNVEATAVFPVPCILPDLIVEDLTLISPEPIFEGEPATFEVTIANIGLLPVLEPFRLSLYLDPPAPQPGDTHIATTYRRATVNVNQNIDVNDGVTFNLTIATGITGIMTHTVYAVVDSDPPPIGDLVEISEVNNISAPAFIRPPSLPDLTIGPLTLLTSSPISTGMPVQFQAVITNTGELDVNNQFFVALYADPDPPPINATTHLSQEFRVALAAVNGLPAGSAQTVLFVANFPSSNVAGLVTKQVYGMVDAEPGPIGLIVEADETNNITAALATEMYDTGDATPPPEPGTGRLRGITYVWINGNMNPQYNVEVRATRTDPPPPTLAGAAFSNASGIYLIDDLLAGNYTVTGCAVINNISYAGSNATAVVTEGQVTVINLYLFPGACTH